MLEKPERRIRNPVLTLPSAKKIASLPAQSKAQLREVLAELSQHCNQLAEHSWRKRKGPMASYWRAMGVYARHISRVVAPNNANSVSGGQHWRSMDSELPPTSEDVIVVARHLDGFCTVIGYDDGEWRGDGGFSVHLSEYDAWTLVCKCDVPVPLDAQVDGAIAKTASDKPLRTDTYQGFALELWRNSAGEHYAVAKVDGHMEQHSGYHPSEEEAWQRLRNLLDLSDLPAQEEP